MNKFEKNIKQRIWDKLQECKQDPFRYLEHLEDINGFKLRVTGGGHNGSGVSYIYMAFAEEPLVSSNGVPNTAR